jgi:N-formylglutamate amidohydrolase
VDCHSFATVPLPSEPDRAPERPDVCIGTDPFHTPPALVERLRGALEADGFRVAVDRPFSGTIVPGAHYRRDARVRSVMLEVRRGCYCDEATGEPAAAFDEVARALERAVRAALA